MRFAIADPPYPGQSKKHYEEHPDYAGEVDHEALLAELVGFDAWALHTASSTLRRVLEMCPSDVRVASWCKSFAAWKRGVYPAYAWEPVVYRGGRNRYGETQTVPDFIVEPMTLLRGVAGAKPERVCHWTFDLLGAVPDDEMHDLFPGSGAVGRAWGSFRMVQRLDFPVPFEHDELPGLSA